MAAIFDIGGFVMLTAAGLGIVAAATLSFLLAAVVNYGLTRHFVFKETAGSARFTTFLAAALIGLAVNVSVTYLAATYLTAPLAVAKIVGVGVAFLLNFTLNAMFVFKPKETAS